MIILELILPEYKLIKEFELFSDLLCKTKDALKITVDYADVMFYDISDLNNCNFETRKKIENNLYYLDKINELISEAYELKKEVDVNDLNMYIDTSKYESDNY